MANYYPSLASGGDIHPYLFTGPFYYVLADFMNSFLHDPLFTVKLLDSLISGLFLMSMFIFSASAILRPKEESAESGLPVDDRQSVRQTYTRGFAFSLAAFFGYQSLALTWGFEKNLLAFSLFLLIASLQGFGWKRNAIRVSLVVLSGLTDPGIVPVEFVWFILMSFRNRKYAPYVILLVSLFAMYVAIVFFRFGGGLSIFRQFVVPVNAMSLAFRISLLALILFFPFAVLIPWAGKHFKAAFSGKRMSTAFTFLIPSLIIAGIIANYFLFRYVIEASVILMLSLQLMRGRDLRKAGVVVAISLLVGGSYVAMSANNPSPVIINNYTMEYGVDKWVPSSFRETTVPIGQSHNIVKLYSGINQGQKYLVVTLQVTMSFAYEVGINYNHIVDCVNSYKLLLHNARHYTSLGYHVYTVWWVQNGWYEIPTLPSPYVLEEQQGQFGLFQYNGNTTG